MGTYDDRWRGAATTVPEGYDRLTARDAIAWLRGLPLHELEDLRSYEEHGKGRATVMQAIDVRLDELEGPVVLPTRRPRAGAVERAPAPVADWRAVADVVGAEAEAEDEIEDADDEVEVDDDAFEAAEALEPAPRRPRLSALPPAPPCEPFQEVEWPEYDPDAGPRRRWTRGTVALVGAAVATVATVGVVQPW